MRNDFLLIAGTNQDLPEAAEQGRFRADLLARINLFDRVQLAEVVRVCRQSRSLSEAG